MLGVVLLAIGGLPWLLWGFFLRTVFGLHATWLVNSATHSWGSRRFVTHDHSTNSWWVALLTWGEGWHNNHHAHPVSARHGLKWYEIDFNWYGIWALKKLGLARHVYRLTLENLPPKPALVRDLAQRGWWLRLRGMTRAVLSSQFSVLGKRSQVSGLRKGSQRRPKWLALGAFLRTGFVIDSDVVARYAETTNQEQSMSKVFIAICVTLSLITATAAQTASDLKKKYPHHEVYEVQPGSPDGGEVWRQMVWYAKCKSSERI